MSSNEEDAFTMFSVIFEVQPAPSGWNTYLELAKMLRPELQCMEGFIDIVRYKSLTREGWILSLSEWRDEKALVRWRTRERHHEAQVEGRAGILSDYHLRVGEVIKDTDVPDGRSVTYQRLDETEIGIATSIVLVTAKRPADLVQGVSTNALARGMGLNQDADGLVDWDVFDAMMSPGNFVLLTAWRNSSNADAFVNAAKLPDCARLRQIRVIRDYGMYDRREAAQYYPAVHLSV